MSNNSISIWEDELEDKIENIGIQRVKDKKNIELLAGNYYEWDEEKKSKLNENSSLQEIENARIKKNITLEEARKKNKQLIASNPFLQTKNFDDRTLYNKKFMLEVSMSGYDANDSEDVENYVNGLPSKYQNRNEIMAGVDKYTELGQSEYDDHDLSKFLKANKNVSISSKTPDKIYLTDFKPNVAKQMLENVNEPKLDLTDVKIRNFKDKRSITEIENEHRKHIAEQFGSKELKFNFEKDNGSLYGMHFEENTNTGIVKSNHDPEKILELIKELRSLGFTAEEIKFEIQHKYS